jgi:hypothetical protein
MKLVRRSQNILQDKLNFINGLMGLTRQELRCLEIMLTDYPDDPAGTQTRKLLAHQLKMSNPESINNVVRKLRIQGALLLQGRNYVINPILLTLLQDDTVEITFSKVQLPAR